MKPCAAPLHNLRIGLARVRFLESYVVSRLNTKHLDRLPEYVGSRLVATFVDDHPPDIDVRMEMLPFWRPFHGIRFDAPVVVGVKGFCTRGRYRKAGSGVLWTGSGL